MTNLDIILKSRDITLPRKVHLVKAVVFPIVMQAERRKVDAFELWGWNRLLRVPWTARKSNQSILKETSPKYSLEGDSEAETPILCPPDVKTYSSEKTLMLGKIEGRRKR